MQKVDDFCGDYPMTLQAGKLYRCKRHLMLYSELETARDASAIAAPTAVAATTAAYATADHLAAEHAAYWTRRLGRPVSCVAKQIPILVLRAEENFHEVLVGDRMGWIIYHDWIEFEEGCRSESW